MNLLFSKAVGHSQLTRTQRQQKSRKVYRRKKEEPSGTPCWKPLAWGAPEDYLEVWHPG